VSYSVQVNTPPQLTSNTALKDGFHIEAVVRRTSSTFVAGAMGFASGTQGATSVAVHSGPNIPFGFALYSKTFETGGNPGETVAGNVYAGQYINPQSNGLAAFCAGKDVNGNATIFLGAPQYNGTGTPSNQQQYGQRPNGLPPDTVQQFSSCSLVLGGDILAQEAQLGCPASVGGISGFTFTYDSSYTNACVITPGISPPVETPPKTGPFFGPFQGTGGGAGGSALSPSGSLTPGVYKIVHNTNCNPPNCWDVDFNKSPANGTYNVTFWLQQGATIAVRGGATVTINPYMPANPVGNDGRFIIYSDAPPVNDPAGLYMRDLSSSLTLGTPGTGPSGCSGAATGTVYLPTGSVNNTSNATLVINGQAIVQSWNVQSGNHTNPSLTYNGCNLASMQEVLQLVQ
jgi:hypothetical protein